MKVLHVSWQPEGYGIGTLLRDLVAFQNGPAGGLQADIVFHAGGAAGLERFAGTGARLTALGASSARSPRLLPRLYGAMEGYDAVFLHTSSPWALLAARARGVRTLYIFHGATGLRGGARDLPWRAYHRLFLHRFCGAVTFASGAAFEKYSRAFGPPPPAKAAIFPYGLMIDAVRVRRERDSVRREIGVEGKFVFGTAARIEPGKALERLIEAAALLPDRDRYRLVIVGGGDSTLEAAIRKRISELSLEEAVIMTGYRNDCRDIVNAFDLFVLPSREEAFGLALLEAMALGIPAAVFADGQGAVEVLGGAGHVASGPGDLALFIAALSSDPARAGDLSRRARARAEELDMAFMAERLKELLK